VYLLGLGLALVALALAFSDWALSLRPGVTEANARRVRPGMTLAEVETLMGGRADYGIWPLLNWEPHKELPRQPQAREAREVWEGSGGRVSVMFDEHNRVTESRFDRHYYSTANPLDRLRAWLGW
jgi:hypothetical protein